MRYLRNDQGALTKRILRENLYQGNIFNILNKLFVRCFIMNSEMNRNRIWAPIYFKYDPDNSSSLVTSAS